MIDKEKAQKLYQNAQKLQDRDLINETSERIDRYIQKACEAGSKNAYITYNPLEPYELDIIKKEVERRGLRWIGKPEGLDLNYIYIYGWAGDYMMSF